MGSLLTAVLGDLVERVDAHIQDVPSGIDQLDRLLKPSVHVDLLKAAETPDPVVDMGYVVAHLQLGQLGEGQSLRLGVLTGHGIALVTLEDLVVGVAGQRSGCVGKTFVQLPLDRLEADLAVHVGKYVLQSADLRIVGAKDDIGQPPCRTFRESLAQQLEIAVEHRLGDDPAIQLARPFEKRTLGEFQHPVAGETPAEFPFVQEQFLGRKMLQRAVFLQSRKIFPGLFHPFAHQSGTGRDVVRQHQGAFGEKIKETAVFFFRLGGRLEVSHHRKRGTAALGELRLEVERPDALHLIAEKLHPVRRIGAEGENIHDASAHCILPGRKDELRPLETFPLQALDQTVDGQGIAHRDLEGAGDDSLAGNHLLEQSFRIAHHTASPGGRSQGGKRLAAQQHIGIVHLLALIRAAVRSGVKQGAVLATQITQVAVGIPRRFLVCTHHQQVRFELAQQLRRCHIEPRPDITLQAYFRLRRSGERLFQAFVILSPGHAPHDLFFFQCRLKVSRTKIRHRRLL